MFKYHCLNPIAKVGLDQLDENYVNTENAEEADAILVRSAKMHEMDFSKNLKVIARAGAGVNNIPLDRCAEDGVVVFNTPGANANGVKELVIAGMLLAALAVLALGGGAGWYFKIYRPKQQKAAEPEEDYSSYDEPDDYDDAPPWDVDEENEGGDE